MKYEPVKDLAERKRILALIERCEKEQVMNKQHMATYINALENRIRELETARPQGEWIPCSERLPKIDTMVILSDKEVVVMGRLLKEDEGFYWNIIGGYCNSFEDWSAWMPLPEPWRGADDEM